MKHSGISRRDFLQRAAILSAGLALPGDGLLVAGEVQSGVSLLAQFGYGDVTLNSELHQRQFDNTHAVLMGLSEDSLMKPFREMSGMPAPGEELGGWYM